MAGNATQTIEIEEAGINFTMPSGMVMADRVMVRDHLLSHSRAVERAAIDAHGQAVADIQEMNEKKQGVPPEVLKAMSCVAFKDAIAMKKEEQDGGKSEGEVNGDGVDKHVDSDSSVSSTGSGSVATSCCTEGACAAPRARSIFGLQVDNEEEDRACEICQSGYSEDDEVLNPPCPPDPHLHLSPMFSLVQISINRSISTLRSGSSRQTPALSITHSGPPAPLQALFPQGLHNQVVRDEAHMPDVPSPRGAPRRG